MNEAELRKLAGAEVMTWNLNDVPMAVSEFRGPLVVSKEGETVKWYPWFAYPRVERATLTLWILDPRDKRVLGEHKKGTWDTVQHNPEFAGFY